MKQLTKILFLIVNCTLLINNGMGQNLVPNPSFEDTVSCPTSDNQLYNCVGWDAYSSPDYFSTCSSSPDVAVPNNWGGFQQPATGDSYVAIGVFGDTSFFYSCDSSSCNSHEFVGRFLSTPLAIGVKYYVSFRTSLSISNSLSVNCAADKLGVKFTNGQPSFGVPSPTLISNSAHIYSSTLLTDSSGWSMVHGTFIADSTYNYIILGNFFDDSNTTTQIMDGNTYCNSYYFIDDVCVSTDSLTCVNSVGINDTPFNQSGFNVYPNPATNQITIENLQLGDAYEIQIYNSLGQLLYSDSEVHTINKEIDINTFSNGLLLINIKSENRNFFYKLLKK
ncbi:MAG: T9SS type A sorting domain-containing protein [Flavobacteriales bacterium]|nr:T9SS type A sorting domain-containing protein [Flavobacteriales bacterium]